MDSQKKNNEILFENEIHLDNTRTNRKDQLLKTNRQFKYINIPNVFQADIMFYNYNLNGKQQEVMIMIFYEMSRKRIYTQTIDNKNKQSTVQAFEKFKTYMQQFDDQNILKIITDEGKEFVNQQFQNLLEENGIKHIIIDASILDKNKALSHINSKCKDIRMYIQQNLGDQINQQEIQRLTEQYNKFQNFEHIIKEFHKTPKDITLDDVYKSNQIKSIFNKAINDKFNVQIGDIVKIQLFKDDIHTKARQKYSQGDYKIINKIGQHFIVSPMNYDRDKYLKHLEQYYTDLQGWEDIVSIPCYFRKPYEMKKVQVYTNIYNESELEKTNYYQIYEIEKCYMFPNFNNDCYERYCTKENEIDNLDEVKKNIDKIIYTVYINQDSKPVFVKPKTLRYFQQKMKDLSPIEQQFWYGIYNDVIHIIPFNKM